SLTARQPAAHDSSGASAIGRANRSGSGVRLSREDTMDRRDILAERPVEKGRGFMPGVSFNPARVLFTAGLTGRNPDGSLVPGGMAPQTHRAFERLEAVLAHAGAKFDDAVKQLVYVTDLEAYNAGGRAERAKFFGAARSA